MRSTANLILIVAVATLYAAPSFGQLYWSGGSQSWSDPNAWVNPSNDPSLPAIPNASTDVVFNTNANITMAADASCRSLSIESNAYVSILSGALNVNGDIQVDGVLSGGKLICASGAEQWLATANVVQSDIEVTNASILKLSDDLILPENKIYLPYGALDGNGMGIVCDQFSSPNNHNTLFLEGTKILAKTTFQVHPSTTVHQTEFVVYPLEGTQIDPGAVQVNWNRTATCGIAPGETPFTITASVASDFNGENISCNGAEDGVATVSVIGGIGPFSYQWVGGNAIGFGQNYTDLGAGTYTVLVTDQGQGITCVDNIQLTEPPPLTVFDFDYTPPSCSGICNGVGVPIVIGGIPPYDFDWGNGEASQVATMLCEGVTSLEFEDQNGCAFDTSFVVELVPIYVNLDITDVICNGTASGEATSTPEGGAGGPYTITWSTGDSGPTVTGLSAQDYTVTVQDIGGCSVDSTFTVNEEPPVTIDIDNVVDLDCNGDATGSIEITPQGGLGPYTVTWTGPNAFLSNDEDIFNLEAGTYNLVVEDFNGCLATETVEITEPPAITVDESITDVLCSGESTGAIEIEISGGQDPYTVSWTGPNGFVSGDEDIASLEPGTYDLNIVDFNGCDVDFSYNVDEPDPLDASAVVTPVSCNAGDDGSIETSPTGGTAPYDTEWTGPNGFTSSDQNIFDLEPGAYSLTLTDDNDCEVTFEFEIEEPDPIDITIDVTPISCNGLTDGEVSASASGGTDPYDYLWVGPNGFTANGPVQTDLEAGNYDLQVTDDQGCTNIASAVVTEPDPISLVIVETDVSCGGLSDGTIELSILGGTPDYTVSWTGPNGFVSSDEDLSGLEAGTYDVTVTDLEGCQNTGVAIVDEIPELEATLDVTPISCNGANDGAIDLTITGGQGPYDVGWAGPNLFISTDEDISGLEAGLYNLLLVDDNGCFTEANATIDEPDPIDVVIDAQDPSCFGQNNGSISLVITGGVGPYDVSWDSGDSGADLTNLPEGTYVATITDDSGCVEVLDPISLVEPEEIVIDILGGGLLCAGDTEGFIETTITGGIGTLDISWTGPNGFVSSDEDLTGLEAGDYDIVVTDENGCSSNASISLIEPSGIQLDITVSPLVCADDLADVTLLVSGGTGPYGILWTFPDATTTSNVNLIGVEQGSYLVEVTDDNDCFISQIVDIVAPDPLTLDAVITELDCSGDPNGGIELLLTGGVEPYNIAWTGPGADGSDLVVLSDLGEGNYSVTVTDDAGCEITADYELIQPEDVNVDATVTQPLCDGLDTGAIDIILSGGEEPYNVLWTGPNGFSSTSASISNLVEGSYTLDVSDAGSCSTQQVFEISAPDPITLDADITNVLCGGDNTGAIDLTISGGTPDYDVVWSAPGFAETTEDIFDLLAGSYQVDVMDDNGCIQTASFDVSEEAPIDIALDITESTCGDASGAVTTTVTGGTDPINIEWFDENMVSIGTGGSISDLAAGSYFVQATDDAGCLSTVPFSISDSDAIQLDVNSTDPLCNADTNGAIDLMISGGTGDLTISWTGPDGFVSSDEDIADLAAGEYTVEVSDELGCFASLSVTLIEPEAIQFDATITNVSCGQTDNGSIEVIVTGGTEPYNVSWSDGNGFTSSDLLIENLEAGDYTLEVSDDNGCFLSETYQVTEVTDILAEFLVTGVSCAGEATGSISTTILSGNSPYDFTWTGPNGFTNSNSDIALLEAGDYNLILLDDAGCSLDTTLTVPESTPLELTIVELAPSCNSADGSLEALVTGGTGDYMYFWYDITNGGGTIASTSIVDDLAAGLYFVEVFDEAGCVVSQQVGLSDNIGELSAVITEPLCFGDFNGTIDLTIDGLTEPFVIVWDGPNGFASNDEDIADLGPGTYQVTVTDDAGCELNEVFILEQPLLLEVSTTLGNPLCAGQNDGSIITTITGGTSDYTITWTGPNGFTSDQLNLFDLEEGCYDLSVVDANGCTVETQVCIEAPDPFQIAAILTNVLCFGDSTASIELDVTGGVGGYEFNWIGPNAYTSTDEDIFDLFSGGYDLQITDANLCTQDTLFVISQTPEIAAVADTTLPACPGDINGAIGLTLSGGEAPYNVSWFEEGVEIGTDEFIDGLDAGTYTYLVTDNFGCSLQDSIELVDPVPFTIDSLVIDVSCFGAENGSIELEIQGGTPPLNVFWIGPNDFTSNDEDIFNLDIGTYLVTIGDAEGCTDVFEFQIEESPLLEASITDLNVTSCPTSDDGSITIEIEGGVEPYTIVWELEGDEVGNDLTLENIGVGNYDLFITDANLCTFNVPGIPVGLSGDVTVNAGTDQAECFGEPIILNGSNEGAQEDYWTDLAGNQLQTGPNYPVDLEPGVYEFIYVGVDAACVDTDTVQVTVFALPTADAGEDESVYFGEQVSIGGSPTTEEGNLFIWTPEDQLSNAEELNPLTTPVVADQWYFLEVVDLNGCTAEDSVLVTLIPELDVPSGFTPNNDGMNDTWQLGNNLFYPSLEVEIYNRWGEMLYRDGNGYVQPWDGTYNGNPLPIGTYYYVINIDEPEFKATMNGPVTILR